MSRELNVLALVKGSERFVFVYEDASQPALVAALHAWALRPDLNFTWFDAALLVDRSLQQLQNAPAGQLDSTLLRRQIGLSEAD
jgi:hypothetical protein